MQVAKKESSNLLGSKEVTMATEPQPTSKAFVNTTLRVPVYGMNIYLRMWEEGGETKQTS